MYIYIYVGGLMGSLTNRNGDLARENGDFTSKNGDFYGISW